LLLFKFCYFELRMASVLHFRRRLEAPPVAANVPRVSVRTLLVPDDVEPWLTLRERAMGGETPAVRSWTDADFRTEMLNKKWWRDEWTWIAIDASRGQRVVGSVTLAMRVGANSTLPVVHWLLVDPAWRRRGVAKLLISYLERAVWESGWREIELETHAGWAAAVGFYQSMGYEEVRGRSVR
jgi:GNAT superfamily N-acetyltransferase